MSSVYLLPISPAAQSRPSRLRSGSGFASRRLTRARAVDYVDNEPVEQHLSNSLTKHLTDRLEVASDPATR